MSLKSSNMMPLGSQAPDFKLFDSVSGKVFTRDQLKGSQGTLVMFICNHCPYVIHIEQALVKLGHQYADSGLSIIAVSANDVTTYPQDGPEAMKQKALKLGFEFPYLYDKSQRVAKAFQAACTPDFFLFDKDLNCVYRGQFDDARPGNNVPVTGKDLTDAINHLLQNKPISSQQKPSAGCSIKWK